MNLAIRQMKPLDIPGGLSLCRSHHWNQLDRDWQIFLQQNPAGCRVAEINEKLTGTVTTIRYQHFFSWIGMLLVNPSYQRKGIGKRLLEEALLILQNDETVKLDATPAGREVYLKLDFIDEYQLSRMEMIDVNYKLMDSTAKPVSKNEIPAIAAFDREIFGADRQSLLYWMWQGAPEHAFVVKEFNKIQGYCLGRQGYHYFHIGPVVANNIHAARQLVAAALNICMGRPVIIDVLHNHPQWQSWLMDIGFKTQRSFIRMFKGANRYPGKPEKQFAIAGPEFG